MMELHQLRYLRAVVRTGSVTAAAEAEFVAQPSVSKQMRLLEQELGVPLFHRVGRRVVPTEAAVALADCADRVFDDLATTLSALSGPESARGGTLRMCATETVTDHLLPSALTELRRRYPQCHVSVEMLGTDDSIQRVLADEVDLAIVALPLTDSRLDIHLLLEEPVLLAVPPRHRWAGKAAVPLGDAVTDPTLLLSMRGHGLRALVEEAASAAGASAGGQIELRSQAALLAMVAAGGGIAFAPKLTVVGREDIATVETDPPLSRQVGWVRRKGRHLPAIGSELLRLLGA
ncbi:MAG TPA: LysR family transcriptional regulator [Tepidiformaceae bacterium]|nr:LysR family transcriptional regulator [Tepidiformaceae bacterium]